LSAAKPSHHTAIVIDGEVGDHDVGIFRLHHELTEAGAILALGDVGELLAEGSKLGSPTAAGGVMVTIL
jgi:hypothetical protein